MLLMLGLVFEVALKLLVRLMLVALLAVQSDVAADEPAVDVDGKYMCEMCFDFHMPTHSFFDTELQQTEFGHEDWQKLMEEHLKKVTLPN